MCDGYLLLTPWAALPRRLKMIGEVGKASSCEIMIFLDAASGLPPLIKYEENMAIIIAWV